MKFCVQAALSISLLSTLGAGGACADITTVNFDYPGFTGAPLATGSFQFDAADTGVVGVNDLITFDFGISGVPRINLSDVQSLSVYPFTASAKGYPYFGWDVAAKAFAPAPETICASDFSYCGVQWLLSGVNWNPVTGYQLILSLPLLASAAGGGTLSYYAGQSEGVLYYGQSGAEITSIDTTPNGAPPPVAGVPEPAAWTIMLLGAGLTGAAARGRRRRQARRQSEGRRDDVLATPC